MRQTLKGTVRKVVEGYQMNHEFGLWDLKRDVERIFPGAKYMHGDTVSRRLREVRHGKDYEILCIKPTMSRYKKVTNKVKANDKNSRRVRRAG